MGAASKIEWTHHTFNPWRGCTKATWTDSAGKVRLHPGRMNCYAEKDRSVRMHGIRWGKGQPRVPKAESGWAEPLAWARAAARANERHRVFCASLADVLDPEVPDAMRERLWDTIRRTVCVPGFGPPGYVPPNKIRDFDLQHMGGLDWLLLTKRPENWRKVPEHIRPLVWLGTSVSDQQTADEWVPRLLAAQGFRYRFLSVEPLVGSVSLDLGRCESHNRDFVGNGHPDLGEYCTECAADGWSGELSHGHWIDPFPEQGINWVIVGGESGPKARPCDVEWVRDIIRQCRDAGVACFVKQMGSVWAKEHGAMTWVDKNGGRVQVPDKKGGDWKNWPEDLRVREFPGGAP